MLSNVAIRCVGLSKRYSIGELESYRTLRDAIASTAAAPFRRLRSLTSAANGNSKRKDRNANANTVWALDDVSFEIKPGDVVGVIGRNGAGKSTLLKVLSRITKPTRGHADINGRIGSLLEVGTGFHPELTGRENIYLNGAILGIRKAEIKRQFDEIVAFAEVEQFIDTPVKRYSSGMYVRLAFAVAAHMETEILLVDEILAVGDAQFQKKCFSKMREIRNQGRTIVLVSHNMAAIRSICNQGLNLSHGRTSCQGGINEVVDAYLARMEEPDSQVETHTKHFVINDVVIQACDSPVLKTFSPCEIRVKFQPKIDVTDPGVYIGILTNDLHRLAGLDLKDFTSLPPLRAGQSVEIGFNVQSLPFLAGSYQLEVHLKDLSTHLVEYVPRYYRFEVVETPVYGGRRLDSWFGSVGLTATPFAKMSDGQDLRGEVSVEKSLA